MPDLTNITAELSQEGRGAREALADRMVLSRAHKTPFYAAVRKTSEVAFAGAKRMKYSWLVDEIDQGLSPAAAAYDGQDPDPDDYAAMNGNRDELEMYGQEQRVLWGVGQQAVPTTLAGVKGGEVAYSKLRATQNLALVIEKNLLSKNGDARAGAAQVGYQTRSAGVWIQNGAQGVLPVPAAYRTPSSHIDTSTALASWHQYGGFADLAKNIYDTTLDIKDRMVWCSSAVKKHVSDVFQNQRASDNDSFAPVRTFTSPADTEKVKNKVSIYEGDWGLMIFANAPYIGWDRAANTGPEATMAYILDMDDIEMVYRNLPQSKMNVDNGGGPRGFIWALYALIFGNPRKHGKYNV